MDPLREFKNILPDEAELTVLVDTPDINEPETNIIPPQASTFELMKIQTELQSRTINEALKLLLPAEGDPNRVVFKALMEKIH